MALLSSDASPCFRCGGVGDRCQGGSVAVPSASPCHTPVSRSPGNMSGQQYLLSAALRQIRLLSSPSGMGAVVLGALGMGTDVLGTLGMGTIVLGTSGTGTVELGTLGMGKIIPGALGMGIVVLGVPEMGTVLLCWETPVWLQTYVYGLACTILHVHSQNKGS